MRQTFTFIYTVFILALPLYGQEDGFQQLVNEAQSAYDSGSYQEAVELYREAIDLDEENAALYYNLGNVYYDMGSYAEAVTAYENSLDRGASDLRVYYNLGNAYYRQGDMEAALAAYEDAQAAGEGEGPDGQLTVNQARTLMQLDRMEEARGLLEGYVEENGEDRNAWFHLGNIAYDQGDLESAAAHYSRATEIDPAFTRGHFNLGNALYRIGAYDQAAEAFEQVLEAEPENSDAMYNLGLSYIALADSLPSEGEDE